MVMELLTNKTMFCNNPSLVNSFGIWHQNNPLLASVPLLLVQLVLISIASKFAELCLRPLGQSSIVAQIVGGMLLGPSLLGQAPRVAETLFPQRGHVIIETLSTFGIILFLFSLGVKTDARLMFKPERIALKISLSLFIFTLIIPLVVTIVLVSQIDMETELKRSLPLLVGSQSLVAFPAIACLLAELKIFNTEVGRLAVGVSMFYDLLALSSTSCVFAYFETQQEGFVKTILVILSIVGFIAAIIIVARLILLRFLVPEDETIRDSAFNPTRAHHQVNEMHLGIVFVVLFISTLLSEIVGQHYYLGPVVFGLSLPDSSPLGAAVVSKVDTFVSGVLYPTFLALSGLKTDIYTVSFPIAWKASIIVCGGVVIKFAAVMFPAMHDNIPFPEAFILGLVMNVRGITELIIYNLVFEDEKISAQDFTLLVISSTLITAIICPLVKFLYDPSKTYIAGRRMTIQHHKRDGEMTILVCVHQNDNIPTIVNVLEASYASKENRLAVIAIILVEVIGKSAPMLMAYKPQRNLQQSGSCNNHVTNAFQLYERKNEGNATVHVFTNMAHFDAMHDDIRRVAAEKRANFIILPFHKQWAIDGTVGAVIRPIREMNLKLLEWAPCSLGILIDRGPANGSLSILNSKSVYRVVVLFIGGADDVEALSYGTRMVRHERVVVTIIRFLLLGLDSSRERKHESEIIEDSRKSNTGNERLIYREELVKDGVGLAESIRKMGNNYDLILVGKSHQHSPLLFGLHEWSECPELGPLGDLLASSDAETKASVLVIQQQKMAGNSNTSFTIGQTTGNRDLFIVDESIGGRPSFDRISVHSSPSVAISIDRENFR